MSSGKLSAIVIVCSILIGIVTAVITWDINFWPTDTEDYYIPAAKQLSRVSFISQINVTLDTETVKWLHGKEMFILCAAVMQKILGDDQTLRPFLLVCIIAVALSSI